MDDGQPCAEEQREEKGKEDKGEGRIEVRRRARGTGVEGRMKRSWGRARSRNLKKSEEESEEGRGGILGKVWSRRKKL